MNTSSKLPIPNMDLVPPPIPTIPGTETTSGSNNGYFKDNGG